MKSNLLLLFVSIVSSLLLFEAGLRLSGVFDTHSEKNTLDGDYFSVRQNELLDSWYWVHPPNDTLVFRQQEFTFSRTTNTLGLSDVEWVSNDSIYTVLGLGDSFTEGTGVSTDSTWLKVAESRLNQSLSVPVSTMNAGVGGSDPVFEYLLFETKLLDYRPDLVILSINSSDLYEIALRGGFERFKEDGTTGRPVPNWETLYEHSHFIRFCVRKLLGFNENLIPMSEAKRNRERFVPMIESIISKMDSLSNAYQFDFLVIVHPIMVDFKYGSYADDEMNTLIKNLSQSDVHCIDIREKLVNKGFRSLQDVESIYWPIDGHFNQTGYALFGEFVSQEIETIMDNRLLTNRKCPPLSQ